VQTVTPDPKKCKFSDWSNYSPCSLINNQNSRYRHRLLLQGNYADCGPSKIEEFIPCDTLDPVRTTSTTPRGKPRSILFNFCVHNYINIAKIKSNNP
jgi:hypothetical protein